jgi:hypothetical protein
VFYYCSSLNSVTIPDGVITIGEQAFVYCSSLTNVTIPSSIKSIETAVFYGCASLTGVAIPNSVTNIGNEAFSLCAGLTSITIPNNVTSIGDQAFALCTCLTNVTIPSSVIRIEGDSFYACFNLEAINVGTLNPAYTSRDGVLFNKGLTLLIEYPCGKAGSYTIPEGVTSIGDFSFGVCRNLTDLKIPDTVTNIGYWAFSQCEGLSRITIPKNVIRVGAWAFQDCTDLREVYFQGDAPEVVSGIFIGDQVSLYYLPGTTGWEKFFSTLNLSGILWNPQAQTNDGSFGVQNNQFGFNITGTTNIPIVLEACTNLANSTWILLQSCTLTNGLLYFSDPQWTNYPARFYRIQMP